MAPSNVNSTGFFLRLKILTPTSSSEFRDHRTERRLTDVTLLRRQFEMPEFRHRQYIVELMNVHLFYQYYDLKICFYQSNVLITFTSPNEPHPDSLG